MNVWQSLAISQSGMDVEQLRAEIAARNIANANVALTPGASAMKPLRVVAQAVGGSAFERALLQEGGPQGGVTAYVAESDRVPRRVSDPGNPLADAQGYVEYPGVNTLDEMFALTMAVRSYEANVTAFNAARSMALKALDIGGRE
jgi:flagellar basal-body rod protein FlgC